MTAASNENNRLTFTTEIELENMNTHNVMYVK